MRAQEVERADVQEAFAAILQARLSWPQADACATDLIGYLWRQGLVVFREYHPDECHECRPCAEHSAASQDPAPVDGENTRRASGSSDNSQKVEP